MIPFCDTTDPILILVIKTLMETYMHTYMKTKVYEYYKVVDGAGSGHFSVSCFTLYTQSAVGLRVFE